MTDKGPSIQELHGEWTADEFDKIQESVDGLMECTECQSTWCDHIEHIIKDNRDASSLWSKEEIFKEEVHLVVPFVPSLGCYASVAAIACESANDNEITARKVILWDQNTGSETFLCIVSPGECRAVIRDAIYAWVQSSNIPMVCNASGHGYQRQLIFQGHLKTRAGEVAEKFSLMANKMCLRCHERSMLWGPNGTAVDPDDFDKDLIPS